MAATPHLNKLKAALANPKCRADRPLLERALKLYTRWTADIGSASGKGKARVEKMVKLLNQYKDNLEVELIMKQGSPFLRRQKGQLKLDSSILEEFLIQLVSPQVIRGLGKTRFLVGPQDAFMSLSFRPRDFRRLDQRPEVVLKTKDQDFVIGSEIHYKLSTRAEFQPEYTTAGSFVLAVLAAECKINLDKTMFQEAAGTAARLKQGCPIAKYFVLVEYLDMEPEDPRLTEIDNVFLLRHARRLPFDKRDVLSEVRKLHHKFPMDAEIVWKFVQEIQAFVNAAWYNPDAALRRGSFV